MDHPRSHEELSKLNILDLEYKSEIEKYPMPDLGIDVLTIRERRAIHLANLRQYLPYPGPIPEVSERDIQIPTRDGTQITLRIYTPDASRVPTTGSPLYVAYHEGGWCFGDLTDEELNCRTFAKEFGAVCVNVEYRLAPEHPWPTSIHDCHDALTWIANNASLLAANPSAGFIIGGASAGANICAILSHLARNSRLSPPLTGIWLCVPAVMHPSTIPSSLRHECISWDENHDDPVLSVPAGSVPYEPFTTWVGCTDVASPLFSPGADPTGHAGLPRTYFSVCGMDPLRDEGLLYERLLRDQGVETRLDLYGGFGHMFWMNYPRMGKSRAFWGDAVEGLRWLLRG
ncbi:alpha/beta-hydrolase [Patellaria atrata CBS 101060]|uniref:Alpha/beta-hydrolase n=1 Tax=Patellaria atrata CBS 101060 TaxID=1346257 RepID=A0A9P4VRV2_9PEZI|nr:alpha/beta-hydrolase [Patellaria atrata CBS 101060]